MSLQDHQQRLAARILAHADLQGSNVIVEADVPDVQSVVQATLAKGLQCIVVAMGGGNYVGETPGSQAIVIEEKFIVTVAQVPGLCKATLSPAAIVDRLIPWLHYHSWSNDYGHGFYMFASHGAIDGDSSVSGQQIVLTTRLPILMASGS